MNPTEVIGLGKQLARNNATRKVTRQINETEAQLDLAGIELSKLMITLLEARAEMGLSATFGDKPIAMATTAIGDWGRTRADTISAHKLLLVIADRLGTKEIAYGDGGERPSNAIAPSATRASSRPNGAAVAA